MTAEAYGERVPEPRHSPYLMPIVEGKAPATPCIILNKAAAEVLSLQVLDEDEFTVLFTKRIWELSAEKSLPFGKEPSEYAQAVARAYWLSLHAEGLSPEECADEDASYWP
ncbi:MULTISPECIES: hypothetical protein [Rhizobium]|uniref:hypothetical protein n=1 Tax=Rhizobium TaxID=379 RepID=UPI001FDFC103|nr:MULTISPECIES: hypothetical protein [Rhizobium]